MTDLLTARTTGHDAAGDLENPRSTLAGWITENGGITHRRAAANAGFSLAAQRAAIRDGSVFKLRRHWLATESAPDDLATAARNSGSLTCVSAARRKGWWIPEGVDKSVHLRLDPHGVSPESGIAAHWTRRIAPPPGYGLIESTEDVLAHVAACLTPEDAIVVWESAVRTEKYDLDALRRVAWPSLRAREYASSVRGLSDAGLETLFVTRGAVWGVPIRQQVVIDGRPIDALVGERLVVQTDGFAYHSDSAQRTRDVAFDAELTLRGYTVLRFTYAHIVHQWEFVERTVARAIASGAHLAG